MFTRPAVVVRLLLVVPLLAAGIALAAPVPAAAATVCDTGQTGPQSGVVFKDSVVVKAGTTYNLGDSQIRGGVTVEPRGIFIAEVRVEIRGSVTATAPGAFILFDVVVRGAVTVTGGPIVHEVVIRGAEVRGDLVVTGYTIDWVDPFFVMQNTVRGSVVMWDNSSSRSPILVQAIAIEGNLDCSGNSPVPTNDFPITPQQVNTVGGVATGQCAGLVAP